MSGLLAAIQPARTIVIERGGETSWWVPFLSALAVALFAAAASDYATWRFKKSSPAARSSGTTRQAHPFGVPDSRGPLLPSNHVLLAPQASRSRYTCGHER